MSRPRLRVWSRPFQLVASLILCAPLLPAQDSGTGRGFNEPYVGFTVATVKSQSVMDASGRTEAFSTGSFSLYGGMKWGRVLGVEVSHDAYGNFPTSDGITTWQRDVTTETLAVLGWLRLGDRVSIFGKGGVALWRASAGNGGDNFVIASSSNVTSSSTPCLGVGLTLDFARHWSIRVEGTLLVKVLDQNVKRLGGGIAYRF
jgi:opacity protein-like surface antigen